MKYGIFSLKTANAVTMRITADNFINNLSTAMLITEEKIHLKPFIYRFFSHFDHNFQ